MWGCVELILNFTGLILSDIEFLNNDFTAGRLSVWSRAGFLKYYYAAEDKIGFYYLYIHNMSMYKARIKLLYGKGEFSIKNTY